MSLRSLRPPKPFAICGLSYLALAAAVAILHVLDPITRGWWLVAFLSLVGGVAQLLLGADLAGTRVPAKFATRAELVLWNAGTATVAVGDLVPSMTGVFAGSIMLIAALPFFTADLREAHATAHKPAIWWRRAYASLLIFLTASVLVGAFLAYARGR